MSTTARRDRDGIQKIGARHYRFPVELQPDPRTGKRRREHHTVHGTREEAKAARARLLAARDRGEYVPRARCTVSDVLTDWLDEKRVNVGPRTHERYGSLVNGSIIPALGALPIQKLTPEHVQRFYAESLDTVSASTVRHRHVALRQALQRAVRRGLLPRNPAADVEVPRAERREMRCLDSEEARRLVNATKDTSLEVPVRLALDTGMRLGELLALRWSDVDLDARRLTVRRAILELAAAGTGLAFKEPKSTSGRRTIDLADATVAFLRDQRRLQREQRMMMGPAWADNDLVVCNACGEPARPSTVSRHFGRLVAPPNPKKPKPRAPLVTCRFHDLRHTHATLALAAGTPVHVVSRRLGHKSIQVTLDLYAHVLPHQDREAAEAVTSAIYGEASPA